MNKWFPHLEGPDVRHQGPAGQLAFPGGEGRCLHLPRRRGHPPQNGLMTPNAGGNQDQKYVFIRKISRRFKTCSIGLFRNWREVNSLAEVKTMGMNRSSKEPEWCERKAGDVQDNSQGRRVSGGDRIRWVEKTRGREEVVPAGDSEVIGEDLDFPTQREGSGALCLDPVGLRQGEGW